MNLASYIKEVMKISKLKTCTVAVRMVTDAFPYTCMINETKVPRN